MSNQKNDVSELMKLAEGGIYVDNLRKLQKKCNELIATCEHPVVFFVLEALFFDLKIAWDEKPVTTPLYDYVEGKLSKPIRELLTSVHANQDTEIIMKELDVLVKEFANVRLQL